MGLAHSPSIVRNGLILHLDAANPKTFVSSSTNFVDLITTRVSAITGNYTYNSSLYATPVLEINNNGSTSTGQVQVVTDDLNSLALTQNFSVMFATKKNFYGVGGNNVGNSQLFQGVTNGYNTGWRISENRTGTPGAAFAANHSFTFGYNDLNTALSVTDTGSTNRMSICAFTVSSSTIFGFLNGVTNSMSNPLTYAGGTSQPRISWTNAGVGSWNGLLGFFSIYNRALSLAEIRQNFEAYRDRYGI